MAAFVEAMLILILICQAWTPADSDRAYFFIRVLNDVAILGLVSIESARGTLKSNKDNGQSLAQP